MKLNNTNSSATASAKPEVESDSKRGKNFFDNLGKHSLK